MALTLHFTRLSPPRMMTCYATLRLSLQDFYWQEGNGAFSVSPSHVEALQNYIADQVEHHRKEDFKEEFRRLLKKYNVEYDEKYVWD